MASASAQLGCSVPELKRAKAAGCAGFTGSRVNIAEVSEWLKANPPDPDDHSKEALECRRLLAQCLKLEFGNEVERGIYTANAQIVADATRLAHATRTELMRIVSTIPTWEGLTAPEMETRALELVDAICSNLSDAASKLYK